MKVLFAPSNIASFASITMEALNKSGKVSAKGISLYTHKYWSFSENWTVINYISWRKNPFKRFFQIIWKHIKFVHLILWADIIHWQWDIGGEMIFDLHYKILRITKKPLIIEWLGSDIRIPEIVFNDNPYYKKAWENGDYAYKMESAKRSLDIQTKFSKLNALPVVCPEMTLFLNKTMFPNFIVLYQRIDTVNFKIAAPDSGIKVPVIVHAPSDKGAKGTSQVRRVIESMKNKGYEFEYIEVYNRKRSETIDLISNADIFLDQFIVGGYGMVACEAMAMAKPVFCYLMPSVVKLLPSDCPIVNTNLDNLDKTLKQYVTDASLRRVTGLKSRLYVEKYHDADNISIELIGVYKKMLQKADV